MHQQGDEANIPPARIPRGMFFVDPAYSSLQEKRRIGTVSEEPVCHCSTVLWRRDTQHRPCGQGNAWYSTGWLEVSLDGNFLVWAGECLTTNKNKWLKSCILTHLDMKASMRDGERSQGSEMQCKKKHYDGQEEGGGSIVPFGLQKR